MRVDHCYQGDCRDVMRDLIAAGVRVQCIVTSPPYHGLRDYGHPGQLGQEPTLREFLANMVEVFELCRELLADDGTLWLNMGDSYAGSWGSQGRAYSGVAVSALSARQVAASQRKASGTGKIRDEGIKAKDLMGQPWRLAFALQDAGWWLRQDIVWAKPNPMPESIRDRCTKAHEYVFLMTKSDRYYFDQDAIREPASEASMARWAQDVEAQAGSDRVPGKTNGAMKAVGGQRSKRNSFARETKYSDGEHGQKGQHRPDREDIHYSETRNKRSVWTIATQSYSGAHFAVMPEALVEPCILAGSRPGDIVFDPFMGSGTVASVAQRLGRRWLGAELNPDYISRQSAPDSPDWCWRRQMRFKRARESASVRLHASPRHMPALRHQKGPAPAVARRSLAPDPAFGFRGGRYSRACRLLPLTGPAHQPWLYQRFCIDSRALTASPVENGEILA